MNSMRHRAQSIMLGCLAGMAIGASADVTLPAIFSDHMVLQKAKAVPFWGKADPGEQVKVSVAGVTETTRAGNDGRWKVSLNLVKAAEGPHVATVEGKNRIEIQDVLIGEVWVCAGQSNMEFGLEGDLHAREEIPRADNPRLRVYQMRRDSSLTPVEDAAGRWELITPASAGRLTAVGYYFGKRLNQELDHTPVGLISIARGNTAISGWFSEDAIVRDPVTKAHRDQVRTEFVEFDDRLESYYKGYVEWQQATGREDRKAQPRRLSIEGIPRYRAAAASDPLEPEQYAAPAVHDADWKPVKLPGRSEAWELPENGAVWFRKTVSIPAALAGKDTQLDGGAMMESVVAYWNGQPIGYNHPHAKVGWGFPVPGKLVKEGANTIAIRLFAPVGKLGFESTPTLRGLALDAEWRVKAEFGLPLLTDAQRQSLQTVPRYPTRCDGGHIPGVWYNGMLRLIIPYGMRGMLWYQGENDSSGPAAYHYRDLLRIFIEDLRAKWGQGEFPFYVCQLPNYSGGYAAIRESQATVLSLPNTGLAVLIDVGEAGNIHPRNKLDVGNRLAAIALAQAYGRKVPFSGPRYDSMTVEGHAIRLRFTHTDGGLVARPLPSPEGVPATEGTAPLQGFTICGQNGSWVAATAHIDGETVLVESPNVAAPVAVRYAWEDRPACAWNLYNGANFPAAPFRTDTGP